MFRCSTALVFTDHLYNTKWEWKTFHVVPDDFNGNDILHLNKFHQEFPSTGAQNCRI